METNNYKELECPKCGEIIEINAWEAWCYSDDWYMKRDENPALFDRLKSVADRRNREVFEVLQELDKRGLL